MSGRRFNYMMRGKKDLRVNGRTATQPQQHDPNVAELRALTSDDIECLWAVGRRAKFQDPWIALRGKRLVSLGMITMKHGWPALTRQGRAVLDELSTDLMMKAHDLH